MTPVYVGYKTLEALMEHLDKEFLIYSCLFVEARNGSDGISYETHMVEVAQPAEDGIHFWRWVVGYTQSLNDEPLDRDRPGTMTRIASTWACLQQWLTQQGAQVVEAKVAGPSDYDFLRGDTGLFVFDEAKNVLRLADGAV